jgi:hypothetical protein
MGGYSYSSEESSYPRIGIQRGDYRMSLWTPKGFRSLSKKQQQQQMEEAQRRADGQRESMMKIVDKFIGLLSREGFRVGDINLFINLLQNKLNQSFNSKEIKDVFEEVNAEKKDSNSKG